MNTKELASAWAVALWLTGVCADVSARDLNRSALATDAVARADAIAVETVVLEDLGSGVAVDLYRVSCIAECIQADVSDAGPYFDARFKVSVNGSSRAFVANASAITPVGGTSVPAEVCAGQNADVDRRAFVEITEVNAAGAENYDTIILCRKANGTLINPTIVKILDQ